MSRSSSSSTQLNSQAWWPQEGWTSILVHNYGGRRKKHVHNASIRDLLVKFPAHIFVLQEHDPRILHANDHNDFHVCLALDENNDETGLCVLARKVDTSTNPCISAVNMLASRTIVCKGNCTPVMVVECLLPHGASLIIVNTHFHHNTAKRVSGHARAYTTVLDLYAELIKKHKAHLLIGDFNQAAPHMVSELQARLPMDVHSDSHHPTFEDCICIFGLGSKAPGRHSDISIWKHLNGAHWPLARHFGSVPRRTDAKKNERKRKGYERWATAKAKAKARSS